MVDEDRFQKLIKLVRQGSDSAAEELVRTYEPHIRRAIRVRMDDPTLRKVIDSMDICQSVLASFFVRAATGQYEITTPAQLIQLLAAMARNKLFDVQRKQRAARRDVRRETPLDDAQMEVPDPTSDNSPSNAAAAKELLQQALDLLDETERQFAIKWANGASWEEIAADVGKSPDALRMQVRRSLDRVAKQLGIDE
jgi:RNA polymerase sigma factor (sigma-70 family)